MDTTQRALISNSEVGAKIGLTHTAVSRLRSGDRKPSLKVMKAIEDWLGWDTGRQINALLGEKSGVPDEDLPWHEGFERQMRIHEDARRAASESAGAH
jgi:transcriptional regulator with XRE-family HTH domain